MYGYRYVYTDMYLYLHMYNIYMYIYTCVVCVVYVCVCVCVLRKGEGVCQAALRVAHELDSKEEGEDAHSAWYDLYEERLQRSEEDQAELNWQVLCSLLCYLCLRTI